MNTEDADAPERTMSQRITAAVVAVARQTMGRGPVSCRTYVHQDAIFIVMQGALTKAEQSAIAAGHTGEVLALRRALQDAMRPQLVETVELITGRNVLTFMSANSTQPDHAAEVFLLDDDPPSN